MNTPKVFTPNTERGGDTRYLLYRRGPNLFSIGPHVKPFRAEWEADDCGLGCKCGAFITKISKRGQDQLSRATLIGNDSKPIQRASAQMGERATLAESDSGVPQAQCLLTTDRNSLTSVAEALPTPRTNARAWTETNQANAIVLASFARELERECITLAAALCDVELRCTQAILASRIGKKKGKDDFLRGELERISGQARIAILKATGAA